MNAPPPPEFASSEEFRSRRGDARFWSPYVAAILDRHGLSGPGREPAGGHNPTNPTFVCGDVVVKLFGCGHWWRKGYQGELAAQTLLATDPEIAAPRLLGTGRLYDSDDAPWPYLITNRLPGVTWQDARLSSEAQRAVAMEVGRQVKRVHNLRPVGIATHADWPAIDVAGAAARSSLPDHLAAQAEAYVARLGPFDEVVVHGDIVAMHVFVDNGSFSGFIDWGDAMVTDRHYELIQIQRDLFGCDKRLLAAFLEASEWPVDSDFPFKAMAHALYRQAIGLTQHYSIDVFEPVAEKYSLDDIVTLDELAIELFAV
ncbi:N/A [soil metagenome]